MSHKKTYASITNVKNISGYDIVDIENKDVVVLGENKYERLICNNENTIIKLPTDSKFREIYLNLRIDYGFERLLIYKKSLASNNTWNPDTTGGWSSQYIPQRQYDSTITFYPGTVTTTNVEVLVYYAMDNVRKAAIGKDKSGYNGSVAYLKVNCWDKNEPVPATINVDERIYVTEVTENEADVATAYGKRYLTEEVHNVTLPTNCIYLDDMTLLGSTDYEFKFTQANGIWTCKKVKRDETTGQEITDVGKEEIDAAVAAVEEVKREMEEALSLHSYIVRLTKAEYEALEVKNSDTLYVIIG